MRRALHISRRAGQLRSLCSSAELPSSAVGQLHSATPAQGLAGSLKSRRENRLSVKFTVGDKPGGLEEVLKLFREHGVNMTRLDTRPSKSNIFGTNIFCDHEGSSDDTNIVDLYSALRSACSDVITLDAKKVPWFPRAIEDLDLLSVETLDAGADLESDHPGFNDEVYRKRRHDIVDIAKSYTYSAGKEITRLEYTEDEIKTWGVVYDKLHGLLPQYACKQYKYILPLLERNCGYAPNNIPQLADISVFLKECTGFQLRPVSGLLSARDFLNALAFRVFFSTQYIRHHATPLYTPEPDVCHELLGHAPMFADPDFADFSHEIGLASLGASDSDIERLASCYWCVAARSRGAIARQRARSRASRQQRSYSRARLFSLVLSCCSCFRFHSVLPPLPQVLRRVWALQRGRRGESVRRGPALVLRGARVRLLTRPPRGRHDGAPYAPALGARSRCETRLPDHDVPAQLFRGVLSRGRDYSHALLLRGEHSPTVPRALLAVLADDRDRSRRKDRRRSARAGPVCVLTTQWYYGVLNSSSTRNSY